MGPSPTSVPAGQAHRLFGTRSAYTGWTTAVSHPTHPAVRQREDTGSSSPYTTTAASTALPSVSTTSVAASTSSVSSSQTDGVAYHKFYRQTQLAFSEVSDQTEYGSWYYLTANTSGLSHESGADIDVRARFINNGSLANTEDTNYRAINDSFPVFGFALDLGSVGNQSVSSLFAISLNQEYAIQFEGASGNVSLPSLWTSYFTNDADAISWFYDDYATASSLSTTFDNQIASDSSAAGGNSYTTITSLATRQAFGATQLVGTPNTTYLFLKEISSDGNIQTVDVIFPFHPILIHTNPTLLKLLLEPLFINQEAGYWPFAFSIHDLGTHYPNATGHNDGNAEQQPLEECGNMRMYGIRYRWNRY